MRVLVAAVEMKTVSRLRSYLMDLGHELETTQTGLGCMTSLQEFLPDLLVMERDILWGGCEGVMSRMNEETELKRIPVVIFTENFNVQDYKKYPCIVARLTNPFQRRDLYRLRNLLEEMDTAPIIKSSIKNRISQYSPIAMFRSNREIDSL